ncbi:glycine/betaine ABC transporter ATP-binding protein [Compostibacillus humi]|uniref:Carnitine transport ATP-binding protein OpuCA n=1 Tax=Compostibacillus humi TaxID=1245525 RepID=A0A8J2TTA7_9BACI|nr:ABC transporter ATP-binding protein [Compostibacillus humi]GFZ89084.1 glycine/betaine ABC transporter ATP-binding protein [Compostibacillus humi]
MIEFENVTKVYESGNKKVTAVNDVSFHVEEGKICVFLGPSGCGKTTLLRMVNRLIPITKGTIKVNGKDVNNTDAIELRRSIGYVIQHNGLFPNMTIEENISVVPKLLGWEETKIKKRYDELMEMMGLDPEQFQKRYPYELSGGQQQRIGIARALAADPPVMLMDEPFGALDPVIREHLQNEFLKIQKEMKKTILFVSHDIDEAIKLGDQVAIFNAGKLMQFDTPDRILSHPKNDFVRDFVGEDRSLKRLSLLKVKDLVELIDGFVEGRNKSDWSGQVISVNDNLRTALSVMLSEPNGEAGVADEENNLLGVLHVSDFSLLNGVHPEDLTIVK